MEKTNMMVEFCMVGDYFNPEEITNLLLIEPTECYMKGSKNIRNIEREESCWCIDTGYIETLYISELFDSLINLLANKKEIIMEVKKAYNLFCKFSIVINIIDDNKPAIYLDNNIIEFANFLGADFDFDLYIL